MSFVYRVVYYGSETWPIRDRTEMSIMRWTCTLCGSWMVDISLLPYNICVGHRPAEM